MSYLLPGGVELDVGHPVEDLRKALRVPASQVLRFLLLALGLKKESELIGCSPQNQHESVSHNIPKKSASFSL